MKVAVLIPANNEEKKISEVIRGCKKYGDVFVVDDGSSDNTGEVSKEAGAKVFRLSRNKGKGFALRVGVKKILERKYESVIMIDGDGQHRSEDIGKFLEKLKEYDIVFGQRKSGKMPIVKRIGNWGLYHLFRLLFGSKVGDTQCGFRAFRSDVLRELKWKSDGYFVDTEIAALSSKFRISTVDIPIIYHDKYKGTTVFDGVNIGIKMFSFWVGEKFEYFNGK